MSSGWHIVPAALFLTLLLGMALWLGARGTASATAAESFPGQGFLPDNRAWEMVSPPDKNGGDIVATTVTAVSAADCSGDDCAISFASLTPFGDVAGTTAGNAQYVARRTGEPGTQGWSTHGITPPQNPPTVLVVSSAARFGYIGDFSDDLSTGILRAVSPVPTPDDPHPNVENAVNLYKRLDLTAPGAGDYRLLTDAPASLGAPTSGFPSLAAASPGDGIVPAFRAVAFESTKRLADAPSGSGNKLYVEADGESHVVNQVPSPADPACGGDGPGCSVVTSSAIAGPALTATAAGENQPLPAGRPVSADGTRVYYMSPIGAASTPTTSTRLYMRNDRGNSDPSDDTFTRIQQSEKTTPESSKRAFFWFASKDGQEAFFTTPEGLVDGDDNGSSDLYRYTDSANPAADANLDRISVDAEGPDAPDVTDVLGVSESGGDVYFAASGELVAGQPAIGPDNQGLYHWRNGEITYLGEIQNPAANLRNLLFNSPRMNRKAQPIVSRVTPAGDLLFTMSDSSGFVGTGGFEGYNHGTACAELDDDSEGCRQLFVYSPEDETLVCASCNPSGAAPISEAVTSSNKGKGGGIAQPGALHLPQTISEDGRYVFFMTADALVPTDTNGPCEPNRVRKEANCMDVYQYDTELERVSLISSGKSPTGDYFLDATDDGSVAFFATRDKLSAWDTDGNYDVYAAMAGGGFPEPPPAEDGCAGPDDCRGPSSGGPGDEGLGSGGFEGEGNAQGSPARDCTSRERKVDKAQKKLRKAKTKARTADGKKAKKRAQRAKKRAKKRFKRAKRTLQRCRGGNS